MNLYTKLWVIPLVVMLAFTTACSTSVTSSKGKPIPEMTFGHLEALTINAGTIEIDNRFSLSSDPDDVSARFPGPPDMALQRYAEKRFAGNDSFPQTTFKFVIEKTYVHHTEIEPEKNKITFLNAGWRDEYDVMAKIRMFTVDNSTGDESSHSILTFNRTITIPQKYSLAKRELEQFKFLELFMKDIDDVVTRTVTENMNLIN